MTNHRNSQTERPDQPARAERQPSPINAEHLRSIIALALADHSTITDVRRVPSVYSDRLGVVAVDRAGYRWRMHVLTEPQPPDAT